MTQQLLPITNLYQHLLETYDLNKNDIPRLLGDILGFFNATLEEYVRTRHLELKELGIRNDEIYLSLQQEIEERRFRAPHLSLRQIRRMIYG
jgi:hypothetical protein